MPRVRRSTVNLCDVRGSCSCICDRRSDLKYPDRTSVFPYLLCTLIIGIFIFVVAVFGTDLVRRVASVLFVCIIAGLLIVYIPNIIAGAVRCWKRIYDAADFCFDHSWSGIYGG